jgi:hypothetical protein
MPAFQYRPALVHEVGLAEQEPGDSISSPDAEKQDDDPRQKPVDISSSIKEGVIEKGLCGHEEHERQENDGEYKRRLQECVLHSSSSTTGGSFRRQS